MAGIGSSRAFWPAETFSIGTTPVSGTSAAAGTWILGGRPMPRTGTLSQLQIYAGAAAAVKAKVLRRSGKTFTLVREASVSVSSGLNTLPLDLAVSAGDYAAVHSATGAFLQYNVLAAGAVSGTEYYYSASEVATTFDVGAATAPTQGVQLQVGFTLDVPKANSVASVGNLIYLGPPNPSAGDTPTIVTTQSYTDDQVFIFNGRLEFLVLDSLVDGLALFYVLERSVSGYSIYRVFSMTIAAGTHTYTAGTDFPIDVLVPNGGMVGYWAWTSSSISSSQSGARRFRPLDAASAGGAYPASPTTAFAADSVSYNPQVRFAIRPTEAITPPVDRLDHTFTTSGTWFDVTGWSVVGGKFRNSATGLANATVFRRGGYYDGTHSAWVTFSAGTDEVAVFRKPNTSDTLGSVATVNVSTGLIALRDVWNGGTTLPAVNTSKTCGFTLSTGVEYKIDLVKSGTSINITITDTTNAANTDTLSYSAKDGSGGHSTAAGFADGNPGFASIAGTLDVSRMKFTAATRQPRVMIFGDSITEGSGATYDADGWAQQVVAAVGSGLISAHAGNASTSVLTRFEFELRQFLPQHVIVLIGTNDTDTAVWESNIDYMVKRAAACGATLWLGAVPAEAADSNPELVMNPYLRTNYPDKVISFDYALTTGGTGLGADRNASLYLNTLHPNDAGHAAMFAQVQADVPSIFS